jgi:hypothetical protein
MPAHDRPQRQSVKSLSKSQSADIDAKRNAEMEKARREISAASASKKRAAKETMEGLTDKFERMTIAGRRHRHRRNLTRRKARRTRRA